MSAAAKAEWADQLLNLGVDRVAEALGLEVVERGTKLRMGCPACGSERRHVNRRDRRQAVDILHDRHGWRCYSCSATGNEFDVIAYSQFGVRYRELGANDAVRFRQLAHGLLGGVPVEVRSTMREPAPEPEPTYPAPAEVLDVWARSLRADAAPPALEWLAKHGCDVERTVAADMVRWMPDGERFYPWAHHWRARGTKLLFRMFDAYGVLRSIEGRRPYEMREGAKALGANLPDSRMRLVFACPRGEAALRDGLEAGTVVWHEGPKKTLQGHLDAPEAVHVGVVSGSVRPELLARFAPAVKHDIRTDPDWAGCKYATEIVRAMSAEQRKGRFALPKYMRFELGEHGVSVVPSPELRARLEQPKKTEPEAPALPL